MRVLTRRRARPYPRCVGRNEVLPVPLARFCHQHPRIEIELVVSNRNEDVLRRDVDIAVRMSRPTQSALLARRLGFVEIGLFAHRS